MKGTMEGVQSEKKKPCLHGFWRDLFNIGLYKRNQGRVTRQVTFAAIALVFLLAAWRINSEVASDWTFGRLGIPLILAIAGLWLAFRLVNMPKFADFLIAVEAEMGKVSWPSRKELYRGSVVVILTIVSLGFVLVMYDLVWQWLLHLVGIGVGA